MSETRTTALPLLGRTILVTRPAQQAQAQITLLAQLGATVIQCPAIEIQAYQILPTLESYQQLDIVVFTSRNAVQYGVQPEMVNHWPVQTQIAAIGKTTANQLRELGFKVDIEAETPYNSEALLAHPMLATVTNTQIAIVRGLGGRDLLGSTLKTRGATVRYIECYQRNRPLQATPACQQALQTGVLDMALFTSLEGLLNMVTILDDEQRRRLLQCPIVVVSDEMNDKAKQLGFDGPILCADSPTDSDMIQMCLHFFTLPNSSG